MADEEKLRKMTIKEKAYYFYQNITVEPMIALLVIPSVFSSLAGQNLILEKACLVNLKFSETVCTALKARETEHYKREDAQVSEIVASMGIWTSLMTVFPVIIVLFAGSWSDRNKRRKPFMLAPICGELLGCTGMICCVYFFYSLPMQVAGFAGTFFLNITGGWTAMLMAVFSYIADITTIEMRTVRIGFLDVFCSLGVPFGTALSGVMVKYLGYYGTFFLAGAFYTLGLAYGVFKVKEAHIVNSINKSTTPIEVFEDRLEVQSKIKEASNVNTFNKNANSIKVHEDIVKVSITKQSKGNSFGLFTFLVDFFNTDHLKSTVAVVFNNKDNGRRRKRIIVLIVVLIGVFGPLYGEMTVMYLFLRYKFNWDEVNYSVYSTFTVIIHLIGTTFSVGVFSHILKIDDSLIGIISCVSKILSGLVLAFAQTDWQVYLASVNGIVNGTSFIALRSIASKLVPPDELGKLNSVYGACEAMTPLVYGPMYSFVFANTIHTVPGAFLLLGGALTLPAIGIFGWMYMQNRQEKKIDSRSDQN